MRSFALLSAIVLGAGCGASGPSVTQACADLAQARCAKRASCSNGVEVTRAYGDMATCLQREQLSCTIGLGAPATGNSPALVEQCVAAFGAYSCADFINNNPPAVCIATGPRAAGAACAFGGQCASTYCTNNKLAGCGVCGDPPASGESCQSTGCGRQQECVLRTETCQTIPAAGMPCDNNSLPCGADLSCLGSTPTQMGTCTAPLAAGMPCGATLGGCDGTMGLACQGAAGAKTCVAISYGADGAACGTLPGGMFASCAAGGDCFTATGVAMAGEAGTCKKAAADGMPCDITLGPPCLTPARCVVNGAGTAGVCTVPSGATCG